MEKIKKWRRFALALVSLLFVAILSFALVQIIPTSAEEESAQVTIHADANGSVKFVVTDSADTPTDEQYDQTIAASGSESVAVSQGQFLHLKATTEKENFLFRFWTVKEVAASNENTNVFSMKATDVFSFEECQEIASENGLWANFIEILLDSVKWESTKLKVDYNEDLGKVYFFMGNPNVTEDICEKHGLFLPRNQDIEIPWRNTKAVIMQTNATFAAIPEKNITSTMDSSKQTSARFSSWSGTYYNGNPMSTSYTKGRKKFPEGSGITEIPYLASGEKVGALWRGLATGNAGIVMEGDVYHTYVKVGIQNDKFSMEASGTAYGSNTTDELFLDTTSLYAEFKEVPLMPSVSAERQVDNITVEQIRITDEQQIDFEFGHINTLALYIEKIGNITKDDLRIMIDGVQVHDEIQDMDEKFLFSYQLHGRATIAISYAMEDGEVTYSDFGLTFHLEETAEESTIEDIIHTPKGTQGNLSITNDESDNQWVFDPVLSERDSYAYGVKIERRLDNGFYWPVSSLSNLQFTLSNAASGIVTFEFQLNGYYQESKILTPNFKVGQLWYGKRAFTDDDNVKVGADKKQGNSGYWDEEIDGATWLGRPTADGRMEFNKMVLSAGGGWYQVSIPIQQDTPLYLGFLVCGYNGTTNAGSADYAAASVSIRDVRLATGNKEVTLKLGADANEGSSATATIGDNNVQNASKNGVKFSVSAGATAQLSATVGKGDTFYGWSVGGILVSTATDTTVFLTDDGDIIAWIAPEGTYAAQVGGMFYTTVDEAVEKAVSGQTVIVLQNAEINKSFTINEGVTLLLPYSNENKLTATGSLNRISWIADETTYRYLTLTVKNSAVITVQGTLAVGGVVNCVGQGYQGHTSGAYAEIILETGSKIQVEKGGVMDVYGRVWGGSGAKGADMGTVEVVDGGKVYEPFLILDFSGGSNAAAAFLADHPTTPFKRYAMINIEVPITVNYGGELLGHASLYALNQFFSLDQPFVSRKTETQSNTFVMLSPNSKVTLTYDPEKTVQTSYVSGGSKGADNSAANCVEGIGQIKMVFEGGATFSYMLFSAMGITVPTNSVYFSIPYNYEVELNDFAAPQGNVHAQYETTTDFMIMPGAKVTVGKGATLTLNANAWVLDGLVQTDLSGKSYPTAAELQKAGYPLSGNLIVNGTLEIGIKTTVQKFELFGSTEQFVPQETGATFLGIVQTDGKSGEIKISHGDSDGKLKTVLEGTIFDGIVDKNYFEYTTTARVWDRAHGCFGSLQAGKTYTAKSNVEFTLTDLKYSAAPGVTESQTLSLNQPMKGSWRVEHSNHTEPQESEWVYDKDKDDKDGGPVGLRGHKTIHRYCTELGCEEKEYSRELLGMPGTEEVQDLIGGLTFKGSAFGSDAIDKLINRFKENYDFDFTGMTVTAVSNDITTAVNANAENNYYTVVITLKGGFFLQGGKFTQTLTLKWQITPFDISVDFGKDGANATASLNQSSVTYDGNEHKIGVASVLAKLTKVGGSSDDSLETSDYDVSYSTDLINAGTVTVTITGKGNYTGQIELTYEIAKRSLTVTVDGDLGHTYGEQAASIGESFTLSGYVAGEEADLKDLITLSTTAGQWSEAGNYDVTAAYESESGALKNYTVTLSGETKAYTVSKKNIKDAVVTADNVIYDGTAQTPAVSFTLAGYTDHYTADDYEISYGTEHTNVGTVTVTVTATGTNYTGSATGTFEITARDITAEKEHANVVTPEGGFTYKGAAWTPEITIEIEGVTGEITYELGYSANTDAGEATITVKGNGNFKGGFTLNFTIGKAKITVKAQDQRTTQGDDIISTDDFDFVITDGLNFESDHELLKGYFTYSTDATSKDVNTEGFDITISLKDGQPDNYEVTISETKGKYYIDESIYKDVTFEGLQVTYNGETQTFTVVQDIEGAVVTLTLKGEPFTGAKDANRYTVSVRIHVAGHNDYTGEVTFEILAKDITGAEITLDDTDLTYTGKEIRPNVTGVTVGGLQLTAEEYADVKYANNTNAGEASVTVTASGNFTGTAQKQFTIQPRNIEGAHVTAGGPLTYNGTEQTPQLTVTLAVDGAETLTLIAGKDFKAEYTNNKNAGMAGVTLTGQTNFTGTMSVEKLFEIKAKPITVTIHGQTFEYAGTTAPALAQSEWTAARDAVCGADDLEVTLSLKTQKAKWEVGTYEDEIQGVSANANYAVTFTNGTLTITRREVTVEIADKESEYGDAYADLTFTVDGGTPFGEGDTDEDLEIALKFDGSQGARLGAGEYNITGTASGANYTVTFRGFKGTAGKYTVLPRKITITIKDQSSVYDNAEPKVEQTAWEVTGDRQVMTNAQGTADNLAVELAKAPGKDVLKDGYAITGKWHNDNYKVEWVEGTYTIEAREVTVVILDQQATYDYHETKEYAFDGTKWQVDAETLAPGEDKSMLGVTLTSAPLTQPNRSGAGTYEITGKWSNTNYAVSFTGSFEGRGGTYTIEKLDISDDAVFILGLQGGGVEEDSDGRLWMRFAGKALELTGDVTFFTDTDKISFAKTNGIKIDPAALEKVGNYKVTISIEDANFMGSAVFEVVVTNENGYTERLEQTLARLRELKAGLTKETLQAKDFAALKEMSALISALDEEELNVASEELAEYETLMEYWNDAADIGAAIETAEKIGDAPIEALFGAVAALTALCGLAYIAMKGGML